MRITSRAYGKNRQYVTHQSNPGQMTRSSSLQSKRWHSHNSEGVQRTDPSLMPPVEIFAGDDYDEKQTKESELQAKSRFSNPSSITFFGYMMMVFGPLSLPFIGEVLRRFLHSLCSIFRRRQLTFWGKQCCQLHPYFFLLPEDWFRDRIDARSSTKIVQFRRCGLGTKIVVA